MASRVRARGCLVVLAVAVLAIVGPREVLAAVCGNGVWESPPEQCDDGNTTSGDGCSSTCQLELPATCVVVPATEYEAAFASDPFFQTVRSRAEHLGYNSALASPVRCLSDDGVTPIYAAVLFDGVDPSRYAIIRSRVDTKEPFLTVLYRDGGDHGDWVGGKL